MNYNSLVDAINEDISDGYSYESSTRVIILDLPDDVDYDGNTGQTNLKFNFDFELRSWGINGVEFQLLQAQVPVYFEVNDVERSVNIDREKIEIQWMPGQVYTVGDFDITLNKDLSVKEATLTVYYPDLQ